MLYTLGANRRIYSILMICGFKIWECYFLCSHLFTLHELHQPAIRQLLFDYLLTFMLPTQKERMPDCKLELHVEVKFCTLDIFLLISSRMGLVHMGNQLIVLVEWPFSKCKYSMHGKVEVLSSPEFKGQSVKFSLEIITNWKLNYSSVDLWSLYVTKLLSIFELQSANFTKIIKWLNFIFSCSIQISSIFQMRNQKLFKILCFF